MVRRVKKNQISEIFNNLYGQDTTSEVSEKEKSQIKKVTPRNKKPNGNYEKFQIKYSKLSDYLDTFNSVDFVYLFREKARENGYKYSIMNIQKDAHCFKRLLEDYTQEDIYLMIDFLYNSDQKYLDKRSLSPTVLISSWCNKIYYDSKDYEQGLYLNKENKRSKQLNKREWVKDKSEDKKIGEW